MGVWYYIYYNSGLHMVSAQHWIVDVQIADTKNVDKITEYVK
jgi:hypothetical protein